MSDRSVQEYRNNFNQLVYQVRLYEGAVSETLLVTQFVLGLKEEIRSAVEIQLPLSVNTAAEYALVQEAVLERNRSQQGRLQRNGGYRTQQTQEPIQRTQFAAGEIWKAKQLKDYRRANGLCYSCGEKYAPGHLCKKHEVQAKAAAIITEDQVYLEDAMLDALAMEESAAEAAAFLSVNALSGSQNPKTIRLRAMVDNKVMLLLVDSGSSHTFIDQQLIDRLQCPTTPLPAPLKVKVANGEFMQCEQEVQGLKWWIQGHTFTTDMKVVPLGGYDAILGMDWLEQWGPMTCHWEEKWIDPKTATVTTKLFKNHHNQIVFRKTETARISVKSISVIMLTEAESREWKNPHEERREEPIPSIPEWKTPKPSQ